MTFSMSLRGTYARQQPPSASHRGRASRPRAIIALITFVLGGPVGLYSQSRSASQQLNDRALAANAGGDAQVRSLTDGIFDYTTLFRQSPETLRGRLYRAELQFYRAKRAGVSEYALADAVNKLAARLQIPNYFPATKEQVRALRVVLLALTPSLIKSPGQRPAGKAFGPDLTPAGAAFLGLLLLDQKTVNSEYQLSADAWVAALKSRRPPATDGEQRYRVLTGPGMAVSTAAFLDKLSGDLAKGGAAAESIHAFLSDLGIAI